MKLLTPALLAATADDERQTRGKSIVRFDPEALREASTVENIERAHATNFAANARFSSYPVEGDDAERKTSAPAKLKSRKDSLAGLTKEERLAKRKASMTAGDASQQR